MVSNYWIESQAADERENSLPKWARYRLDALRAACNRLMDGVVESASLEDARLAISLGSDGHGGTLYRPLPENASIVAKVTGGEMNVHLRAFGSRTRLGITGHGTWHPDTDRNEIAVLPALSNVVEVTFVSPAVQILPATQLGLPEMQREIGAGQS